MANEIVKYHNEMNAVSFRKFTSVELDLFFSICYKLKEKGSDEIVLSFDELKRITNYKFTGNERFLEDLESVYDKLIQINFKIGNNTNFTKFVLFNKYSVMSDNKSVLIALNKEFSYILNDLTANFTRFELEEFTKLRSSYSKQMFKLLAQFKSTGFFVISIDDFKKKLDIPVSYRMSDINKSVIKAIMIELKFYFKELKLKKIKKGRNIDKLEFTWEKRDIKIQNKNFDIDKNTIIFPSSINNDIEEKRQEMPIEAQQSLEKLKKKLMIDTKFE